jgi:epoxyqueuosine reductase QueG
LKDKNYLALKKFCQGQGIDLFGVADIRELKREFMLSREVLSGLDRAICLGVRLSAAILNEIQNAPTRLYFHHYRTVNAALDQAGLRVCNYIQNKGFLAMPIPASQILDWENQKAHLSHKKLGVMAGLGWIGRNNLLVNSVLGSQFRLASILTDMPLKTDKPVKAGCGACRLCIEVCPAGAIKDSPSDFNHIECFGKLKEFQKQRLVQQHVCGICVKACAGPRFPKKGKSG